MERKHLQLELKADEKGTIEGYGSVFDVVDQGGDIVAAGAFRKSLASGRKPKMLLQHNASDLIGVWDEMTEDGQGLRVKGRLLTAVAKAREAYELVKAGALDGLSIGYRVVRSLDRNGRRVILEADLWEVSLVSFPMNEAARIDAVKSADLTADQCRELEAYLRMKGLSRTDAVKAVSGLKEWLRREVGGAESGVRDERGPGIEDLVRFMRDNTKGASCG
jgi:uncharacterized protein